MRWPGASVACWQIGRHVEIGGLLAERVEGQRGRKRRGSPARRRSPTVFSACASLRSSVNAERGRKCLQLRRLLRCRRRAPATPRASASRAASGLPSTMVRTHQPLPAFRIAADFPAVSRRAARPSSRSSRCGPRATSATPRRSRPGAGPARRWRGTGGRLAVRFGSACSTAASHGESVRQRRRASPSRRAIASSSRPSCARRDRQEELRLRMLRLELQRALESGLRIRRDHAAGSSGDRLAQARIRGRRSRRAAGSPCGRPSTESS